MFSFLFNGCDYHLVVENVATECLVRWMGEQSRIHSITDSINYDFLSLSSPPVPRLLLPVVLFISCASTVDILGPEVVPLWRVLSEYWGCMK
jgi:hypothetical protein